MSAPKLARSPRRGFTLVEMLVVLVLLLMLAAISVAFIPRVNEDQKATRGADVVVGQLLIAKQRALRDRVATGVRFQIETTVNGFNVARNLVYIQQQDPYYPPAGVNLTVSVPPLPPAPPAPTALGNPIATAVGPPIPPFDFSGGFGGLAGKASESWPVQPGDILDLGNGTYTILGMGSSTGIPTSPTIDQLTLGAVIPRLPGTLVPNPAGGAAVTATFPQWRVVRQPRILSGEQPVQLPQDAAIDFSGASLNIPVRTVTTSTVPVQYAEILFGPSGQVVGAETGNDKIILCVWDVTRDRPAPPPYPPSPLPQLAKPVLVAIQTRTGQIGAHPADTTNPVVTPNPTVSPYYSAARDGQSSGL